MEGGFLIADRNMKFLSGNIDDYPEGIVFPIDKPYRWTSADVIRKVKHAAIRHFGKKNLKVGHAGTLDPLATGVLLVCVGKATKQAETLQKHDKEYIAGISFGATTPSYDLEKEIDRLYPWDGVTLEALQAVLPSFLGEQEQVAPLFSAKSVDGVRAYELARNMLRSAKASGSDFDHAMAEILNRQIINISDLELLGFEPGNTEAFDIAMAAAQASPAFAADSELDLRHSGLDPEFPAPVPEQRNPSERIHVVDTASLGLPRADIRIACTKGTYVRAFARDLGESLGTGAHLHSLRRTRTGGFSVSAALSVDQAITLLNAQPE